jgi:hypothetical protein
MKSSEVPNGRNIAVKRVTVKPRQIRRSSGNRTLARTVLNVPNKGPKKATVSRWPKKKVANSVQKSSNHQKGRVFLNESPTHLHNGQLAQQRRTCGEQVGFWKPSQNNAQKKIGRPSLPKKRPLIDVIEVDNEEDGNVEVLRKAETLEELVTAENELQVQASASKKKRPNNSKEWKRLVDNHEELVAEMVIYFSSHPYAATVLHYKDRVAVALGVATLFPPQATLKLWADKATSGKAMKLNQGGTASILSPELQCDLLEIVDAIRAADLAMHWKVVRRHALALISVKHVVLPPGSKFPSKSWCKVQ